MRYTVALGLKLAIFNSCQGLGIAQGITEIQLPSVIVMRQPIPDSVAQAFVKQFLTYFTENHSIPASLQAARQHLRDRWESTFPYSSWLPVLCQTLNAQQWTWQEMQAHLKQETSLVASWRTLFSLDVLKQLEMNMLKKDKGTEVADIYIPNRLAEIIPAHATDFNRISSTKIYEQSEFFNVVLQPAIAVARVPQRFALVGEPGIGKTRALQQIGNWINWNQANPDHIAIWVSLSDLKPGQSLESYLRRTWFPKTTRQAKLSQVTWDQAERLFLTGRVWLMLDGGDELASSYSSPIDHLMQEILRSSWLSRSSVILTCRLTLWKANLGSFSTFKTYQLEKFSAEHQGSSRQITDFIRRWFISTPEVGENLQRALQQERWQRIQALAQTPLLLSILCAVWELNQDLPETRSELYRRFVDTLYQWKRPQFGSEHDELTSRSHSQETGYELRHLRRDLDRLRVFELRERRHEVTTGKFEGLKRDLAKLAKLNFDQNINYFKYDIQEQARVYAASTPCLNRLLSINERIDAQSISSPYRIPHYQAQSVLHSDLMLAEDLGLLKRVGIDQRSHKPIYAFLHPTIQDYFAAQAIDATDWDFFATDNTLPVLGTHRVFEHQWHSVILFWLGRPQQEVPVECKEILLQRLWHFKDYVAGFYTCQVRYLIVAALSEFLDCSDEVANPKVQEVLDDCVPYLISDEDSRFPRLAYLIRARAAIRQTDPKRLTPLIELLDRLPISQLQSRMMAATLLVDAIPGNQQALEVLLDWFRSPEDELDRLDAVGWLEQTGRGNNQAVRVLSHWLATEDVEHKTVVAQTLAIIAQGGKSNPQRQKYSQAREQAIDYLLEQSEHIYFVGEIFGEYRAFERIAQENLESGDLLLKKLLQRIRNDESASCLYAEEKKICAALAAISIASSNRDVINILLNVIRTNTEIARDYALTQLTAYGKQNALIIQRVIKLLREFEVEQLNDSEESIFLRLTALLSEIAVGDLSAIAQVKHRLNRTPDYNQRLYLAQCLLRIDPDPEIAIATIENLMQRTTDRVQLSMLAKTLAEAQADHPLGIDLLLTLLDQILCELNQMDSCDEPDPHVSEYSRQISNILSVLREVAQGQEPVTKQLTQKLKLIKNQEIREIWIRGLGEIDPGHPIAIEFLLNQCSTNQFSYEIGHIINKINPQHRAGVLAVLIPILQTSETTQQIFCAKLIHQLDPANWLAAMTLFDVMITSEEAYTASKAEKALLEVLQNEAAKPICIELVRSQREALYQANEEGDAEKIEKLLKIYWHCAEVLPYSAFYRAFHPEFTSFNPRVHLLNSGLQFYTRWGEFVRQFKNYVHRPSFLMLSIVLMLIHGVVFAVKVAFYLFVILVSPLVYLLMQLSKLSNQKFGFNILGSVSKLIASVLGLALLVGVPIYVIYRLIHWLFMR
ncbi:NACHT domain-containing protein [Pseudanabaenaceae cyanobacterium LEGE 13415]|nr:NACHT domain-containing protein [Pseudanabaenaceae cyanobacterium LEGE 13415]